MSFHVITFVRSGKTAIMRVGPSGEIAIMAANGAFYEVPAINEPFTRSAVTAFHQQVTERPGSL